MKNCEEILFGQWCSEVNDIKKARKIKKVFDKMLGRYLNATCPDDDYSYFILIKSGCERNFDIGYRR